MRISPYSWFGWDKLWRETVMRLLHASRHPDDCPLREDTLRQLEELMGQIRKQLDDNQPC